MSNIVDSFNRGNGALGSNWATVVSHNAETGPDTFAGGININSNGYGPINAHGGDATSLWAGGGTFANNQWATAVFNTVAAFEAVLAITAAAQSGSNTTYTYTVSSGNVTAQIAAGALYVKISGMAHAGNNGTFTATTFGAGTFTVANASGVTATESGTGNCASDSGAGVMLRGSGTTAATLNGYFFHVGTNSFGGGGRVAYYELWKVVNGVGTDLANAGDTGNALVLPLPGDILALSVDGSQITAYYNNAVMYQVTDTSITSGVPGVTSWACNGGAQYIWANWNTFSTATGNNGTTLKTFAAGDYTTTNVQLATDALTSTTVNKVQRLTDPLTYANGDLHTDNANWVYGAGSFTVSTNRVFSSNAATSCVSRQDLSWPDDQYSEATMVIGGTSATQNCGPAVRVSKAANTFYCLQTASNILKIGKDVAGTFVVLATSAQGPPITGDVLRLQVIGTNLSAFKNGVAISDLQNISDSAITSGAPGLFGAGNATTNGFSTWAGGNVQQVPTQFTMNAGSFGASATNGTYGVTFDTNIAFAYQNTVSWPNDQYAEIKMTGTSITPSQQIGPVVRSDAVAVTRYEWCAKTGGTAAIAKRVAGVGTSLISVPYTFTTGDVFRLEVIGTMLIGRVNGVAIATAFDSAITSGNTGFMAENTVGNPATPTGTFINWAAGSAALPPPPVPPVTGGGSGLGYSFNFRL